MKKEQRPKVRLSRDHQTYIPIAADIRDKAKRLEDVSMISAGFITGGVRPGIQHVKIKDEVGCILLVVRGVTAVQELRVYSRNLPRTKLELARFIRDADIRISFN